MKTNRAELTSNNGCRSYDSFLGYFYKSQTKAALQVEFTGRLKQGVYQSIFSTLERSQVRQAITHVVVLMAPRSRKPITTRLQATIDGYGKLHALVRLPGNRCDVVADGQQSLHTRCALTAVDSSGSVTGKK